MSKSAVCGVALAATLILGPLTSQAREVNVWGHKFVVDDDSARSPTPPRFDALVAHPERYDVEKRGLYESDPPR